MCKYNWMWDQKFAISLVRLSKCTDFLKFVYFFQHLSLFFFCNSDQISGSLFSLRPIARISIVVSLIAENG